jgi:hypothetical protein
MKLSRINSFEDLLCAEADNSASEAMGPPSSQLQYITQKAHYIDDIIKSHMTLEERCFFFRKVTSCISSIVYTSLLSENTRYKLENVELKEKNKTLGIELNKLMQNRRLEKKRLELLQQNVLLDDIIDN